VIPPDQWPDAVPQPDWMGDVFQTAAAYCRQRRAFLLIDPPPAWADDWLTGQVTNINITQLGSYGPEGENAAVYFPNLVEGDPLQNGAPITMAPSGALAGIYARTDAARGVWKAPAGMTDGAISGVTGLELRLTDFENGQLNPQGINALRTFPVYGTVVWGARTLKGADVLSDDYKYVPVRRLALYIEQSLYNGTQWAVFEPNAEPLWSSLRLAVGGFMNGLFRQGAFAGTSAAQAYSVRCDATTTTQTDIDNGVVNVQVGFAPLKPAEFVVLTIQQIAGQIQT
jgi:phage tail sheath protein FI